MKELIRYLDSKIAFKSHINQKIEGRCHVNNKGWAKLMDYHLDNYLKGLGNPYGFLYNVKTFHGAVYRRTRCMPKYYYKYWRKRQSDWDLMVCNFNHKE